MQTYDLAIAYKWIYDRELTELIEKMFLENELSTYIIGEFNYTEVANALRNQELSFRAVLDRASDEDENFADLARLFTESNTYVINNYEKTENAIDKYKMHNILDQENFPLPYTYFIPPFDKNEEVVIPEEVFEKLGCPYVIKPSYYSGGGDGVIIDACGSELIRTARNQNPDDYYLLQKRVYPKVYNGRRVWIRSYWFFDEVFIVWWDDQTHIYSELNYSDFQILDLNRVVEFTTGIAELSGMDYFSSEFTIDQNEELFIIDYVNDQCDMRMKPEHFDGVPKIVVEKFIRNMINKVRTL